MRERSTTRNGARFTYQQIRQVWAKAEARPIMPPATWWADRCGNLIRFDEYGQASEHGWEIDHILPVALGGPDILENLQPLHWEENRRKGDHYPWSGCGAEPAVPREGPRPAV